MSTKFLQIPEGKIAYDDTASGRGPNEPLVVCAPGMGDVRGMFRFLVPQLAAEGYRVVTMDNRGHGESSVGWKDHSVVGIGSDILALIRHLNAGPAIVIGHSISAGGAIWAALHGQELVSALVLIGPGVNGHISSSMQLLTKVLFARPWGPAAWIWYYGQLYPSRKPADWAEYTAALGRSIKQPGRLEALQQMMASINTAPKLDLEKVRVPALVVMGSKDPDNKPDAEAEARRLADSMRGSYAMVEGAGHYPHVEMPEVTIPKITAFLKTLQPEASYAETAR